MMPRILRSALMVPAALLIAHGTLSSCRVINTGPVQMRVLSNAPDTTIRIRDDKIDIAPDEGWEVLGTGTEVTAKVANYRKIELEASAPGYRTKVYRLNQPEELWEVRLQPERNTEVASTNGTVVLGEELPGFTGVYRALVVGVSNYRDMSSLPNAATDADSVAETLRKGASGGVRYGQVEVLKDAQATRANIIKELEKIAAESEPGDMIFFYFAGHGQARAGERYLMPPDASKDNPGGSGLEQSDVYKILDRPNCARRQMVVLDCCHAGGDETVDASGKILTTGFRDSEPPNLWEPPMKKGRVVLTSTMGGERAIDGPPGQRSPFADNLIKVLSDANADLDGGGLSASELYAAIAPRVRVAAESKGGRMNPQIYGKEWADELVVLKRR